MSFFVQALNKRANYLIAQNKRVTVYSIIFINYSISNNWIAFNYPNTYLNTFPIHVTEVTYYLNRNIIPARMLILMLLGLRTLTESYRLFQ